MDHLTLLWGLGEGAPKRHPLLIFECADAAAEGSLLSSERFISVNLLVIPFFLLLSFPPIEIGH